MKTIFRRLAVAVLGCLAIGLAQVAGATAIVGVRIDQTLSFDCNPLLSYSPTLSSTSQSAAVGDATRSLTVSTQSSTCTGATGAIAVSAMSGTHGEGGHASGTAEVTQLLRITNPTANMVPHQPDGFIMVGATFNQSEPFTFVSGIAGCPGRGDCAPGNPFDQAFLSFTYSVDCDSSANHCGGIAISFTNTFRNGAHDIADIAITVDDRTFLPHETRTYTTRLFLDFAVNSIPEPNTLALALAALGMFGWVRIKVA